MLKNLKAEMARHGVTRRDLSAAIGKSSRSVTDKTSGKYPFSMAEALRIRNELFPGLTLEYLFEDVDLSEQGSISETTQNNA